MNPLISKIDQILSSESLYKATLSKPRDKHSELRNIYITLVEIKGQVMYSLLRRYKTKDETHQVDKAALLNLMKDYLEQDFYYLDITTNDNKYSLLQSKKGAATWKKKGIKTDVKQSLSHDAAKKRLIPEDTPFLRPLGLSSSNGKVYQSSQRKFKQINRYVELISHLLPSQNLDTFSVADMGSGKGYLTFALHQYLVDAGVEAHTIGVEMRQDLVDTCNGVADDLSLPNLTFIQGNIQDTDIGKKNMVIALHACDIATDMAIAKACQAGADYIVVAPCCHKQIRKAMGDSGTLSPILKHGILKERMAEMLTDTIRSLLLEAMGYKTQVFEFISSEHTGKNVMITAVKSQNTNAQALEEVSKLKEEFGVESHYLETLLPFNSKT